MTLADFILIALIFVVLPVESWFSVRIAHRHMANGPSRAREYLYAYGSVILWALAIAVMVFGVSGRDPAMFSLGGPTGWRGYAAWSLSALVLTPFLYQWLNLLRQAQARNAMRSVVKAAGGYNPLVPRSGREVLQFMGVGFTAGVTEEIIFRAYLLSILATVLPLWLAALLALIAFALPHAYQGFGGMVQAFVLGGVLTAIVLLGQSIWPAIVLHILIDWLGALINWTLVSSEKSDEASFPDVDKAASI